MRRLFRLMLLFSTALPMAAQFPLTAAHAQAPSSRVALVIGESDYGAGAYAQASNDAGLVASTLQQAGFDVVGARDLDQDSLRSAFRSFLQKAQAAGPQGVAFVYLAGYGLQYDGENYFAPVDAQINQPSDVPISAVRISDLTRALSGVPLRARVVALDLARDNPFARQGGAPLAGGLALVEPDNGSLIAFNAAPDTIAPQENGPYGAYAKALAEMASQPGVPANDMFAQIRLRVNQLTNGDETPWNASALGATAVLIPGAPGAAPPAIASSQAVALRRRPINQLDPAQAYSVALDEDTIGGYTAFVQAFPRDPMTPRIRRLLAARREALIWQQTVLANRPNAYWTYMRRYPHGPHAADAGRRLGALSASLAPPASFEYYSYRDVAPPPPDEVEIIDAGPTVIFREGAYPPPPPPPVFFIGPPPPEFVHLPPPPRPERAGVLPSTGPLPFVHDDRRPRDAQAHEGPIPLPAGVNPHDERHGGGRPGPQGGPGFAPASGGPGFEGAPGGAHGNEHGSGFGSPPPGPGLGHAPNPRDHDHGLDHNHAFPGQPGAGGAVGQPGGPAAGPHGHELPAAGPGGQAPGAIQPGVGQPGAVHGHEGARGAHGGAATEGGASTALPSTTAPSTASPAAGSSTETHGHEGRGGAAHGSGSGGGAAGVHGGATGAHGGAPAEGGSSTALPATAPATGSPAGSAGETHGHEGGRGGERRSHGAEGGGAEGGHGPAAGHSLSAPAAHEPASGGLPPVAPHAASPGGEGGATHAHGAEGGGGHAHPAAAEHAPASEGAAHAPAAVHEAPAAGGGHVGGAPHEGGAAHEGGAHGGAATHEGGAHEAGHDREHHE